MAAMLLDPFNALEKIWAHLPGLLVPGVRA